MVDDSISMGMANVMVLLMVNASFYLYFIVFLVLFIHALIFISINLVYGVSNCCCRV
jgi:hypothetical protein